MRNLGWIVFSILVVVAVVLFLPANEASAPDAAGTEARGVVLTPIVTSTPTSSPTPTPTPTPTPSPTPVPTPTPIMLTYGALYEGISDTAGVNDVKRLQSRLIELGYLTGMADGNFGPSTKNAVQYFQGVHGLDKTGVADDAMQSLLYSVRAIADPAPSPTPLALNARGDTVSLLQGYLVRYGFMSGAADGVYGEMTASGVKLAQDYMHTELLKKWAANPTPTPSPTYPWMFPTPTPYVNPSPTADPATGVAPAVPTPTPKLRVAPSPTPWVSTDVADDELIAWLASGEIDLFRQTVRMDDKNAEVWRVQNRLVTLGYLKKADGHFGSATERSLKYFQLKNNLPEDGVAGEQTQRKLFSDSSIHSETIVTEYRLVVDTNKQRVYVYQWTGNGFGVNPIKTLTCSTGKNETPTPTGVFWNTLPYEEWHYFKEFECYGRYAWVIDGGIMFHSVTYDVKDASVNVSGKERALGKKASHGCVRLSVENAKWIFDNCPAGTPVEVK